MRTKQLVIILPVLVDTHESGSAAGGENGVMTIGWRAMG